MLMMLSVDQTTIIFQTNLENEVADMRLNSRGPVPFLVAQHNKD